MAKTLEILCEEYNDRAPAPISTPKIGQRLGIVVWPPCVGDRVTTCAVALRWDFGSYFCTSRGHGVTFGLRGTSCVCFAAAD